MLELGYFPGCSLHKSARNYDETMLKLFEKLSIELTEIDDWNCCGATSAHFTNDDLATTLSARNLALAEEQGHHSVLAPCAACFNRLLAVNKNIRTHQGPLKKEGTDPSEPMPYSGTIVVRNLLDVLMNEVGPLRLATLCKTPLSKLKIAAYYGCLLVRTPGVDYFEDRENPSSMEDMLKAIGAKTVDWPAKTDCCGASLAATEDNVTNKLMGRILDLAKKAGANCIATACPLCQTNLDMFQWKTKKTAMPVFFLSELLALALGASVGQREWRKHFIRPDRLIQKTLAQTKPPAAG
jgi:heterodisulfide reductase subunit B